MTDIYIVYCISRADCISCEGPPSTISASIPFSLSLVLHDYERSEDKRRRRRRGRRRRNLNFHEREMKKKAETKMSRRQPAFHFFSVGGWVDGSGFTTHCTLAHWSTGALDIGLLDTGALDNTHWPIWLICHLAHRGQLGREFNTKHRNCGVQ